jgi:hypothetical protein
MGRTACTEPQYLYKGALYLYLTVELYLSSPYGPYGLYRASVPVQGVTFTYTLPLHCILLLCIKTYFDTWLYAVCQHRSVQSFCKIAIHYFTFSLQDSHNLWGNDGQHLFSPLWTESKNTKWCCPVSHITENLWKEYKQRQLHSLSIPGHWGFFPGHQTVPCALGSTQPLKKWVPGHSWGKDGRCVRVMTFPPSCAECLEILEP